MLDGKMSAGNEMNLNLWR